MILSDLDIGQMMASGDIQIDPFSGELEPASYDLRVGAVGLQEGGRIDIDQRDYITIPRGAIVIISTLERIELSTKLAARYGLRSTYARRGLILLSGPQIDPGFRGRLNVTLFNAGTEEITLTFQDRFATIEFAALQTPASAPYQGQYQDQARFTADEIATVTKRYKNFSEIEDSLTSVQSKQSRIEGLVIAILTGIFVGVVILILQEFVFNQAPMPLPTPSGLTP